MGEFKAGDRVRMLVDCSGCKSGEIYTLIDDGKDLWAATPKMIENAQGCSCKNKWELIERSESMSRYEELKQRIEALSGNSTLKEADDILQNILSQCEKAYDIKFRNYTYIKNPDNEGRIWVSVFTEKFDSGEYSSQCEKMRAFKSALLWLLDHSDIKKDDKQAKIDNLQKQIDSLQEQIGVLRSRLLCSLL